MHNGLSANAHVPLLSFLEGGNRLDPRQAMLLSVTPRMGNGMCICIYRLDQMNPEV